MPKLRLHAMSVSLDGHAAGPAHGLDAPLGAGGEALHHWAVATATFHRMQGRPGGTTGVDDEVLRRGEEGIGATTFTFVPDGIESALERAFAAARGLGVRLGGGPATVQQYLRAGPVDELHVAVVPVLLGGGERLLDGLEGAPPLQRAEVVASPSAAHIRTVRR